MTMIRILQLIDAGSLFGCVLCLIVVMQREYAEAHWAARALLSLFGVLAFAQAMWLVGVWQPGAAGYPWPRAALDSSLFVTSFLRVVAPRAFSSRGFARHGFFENPFEFHRHR